MLTDVLGNPTQEYQYDVFGATRNVVRDPFNRYRFVGLQHDDLTGLIYMNARWYDPAVGRFLSRDPVEGEAVGNRESNRYVYAQANPALLKDCTGLATALFCQNVEQITFLISNGKSETFQAANYTGPSSKGPIPDGTYRVGAPMPVPENDKAKRESMGTVRWPIEGVPGRTNIRFHFGGASYCDPTAGCIRGDRVDEDFIKELLEKDPWTSIDVKAACK